MSDEQKESIKVRVEELIVDFERLDAELSTEESEIVDFEKRYFDLKLKFKNKIDAIDASRSINVSGQNISIAIPTEQSSVHSQTSLSNIQKSQYLKGLLSDEPASLIKHIPLSNESYEEAGGKLIDRYDKKKQIVYALFKIFLDQRVVSQVTMTNLRNLVDTSDEVLRGLKGLGTEATHRDPWLIQILMQKLEAETKRLWSVKTAEKDFPTLQEFLEFLNVRCSPLELMTCNDCDIKVPTKSNFIAYKNNPGDELMEILSIKFELLPVVDNQLLEPLFKPEEFDSEFEIIEENRKKSFVLAILGEKRFLNVQNPML
ncbi:uncharacterized protein TNCT_67121 [Trichonephila clavata]|uniref:Uncharacterized protein n=1 Tax=Trichonephila clavata TaxID=2740835 RepID=A0A8X6K0R0_TRICU|nr:uncharacterized protein TNCT_67121 [Trichonephila clavata]